MQIDIYEVIGVIGVIVLFLFGVLIIYDLYRIMKLKKYTLLRIPVIVDMILLILLSIFLYTVFNISSDYQSVSFAEMYLLRAKVQALGAAFLFIRVVLVKRLKRK